LKSSFLMTVRGYVRIEVRGSRIDRLINALAEQRMTVWDIRFVDESRAELFIVIKDFFRLRPLLRQTGCRIHVRERYGLPFMLDKLEKRKIFAIGLIGFVLGLYMLSSIVWEVRVEGNERISKYDILQAAQNQGIYKMQWKRRLKNNEQLARAIQSQLPGTAWVGVELQGTHVVIKVVEATIPEKPPLRSPRHLIASKNALVTSILAEKGRPLVKANTYVRKGDVLISGIIGDGENLQTVVASGEVKGLVWYNPTVEIPLVQSYKTYTGEAFQRQYVVFGNRALQLTGYGKQSFDQFETIPERKTLQWRNYVLPIGWLKERVMEVREQERTIEPEEARKLGLEQAKREIVAVAGKDAKVIGEKILHEKTENGKVYMEVLLEVEESITEEQPIVP